ncbi:MAG: Type I restriction-modification system methyltransferase subunit [Parcubacteria group bacterium GW2011_GWA1_36_12]|nr:MAG: Type I restriction-modification system methyltransferase subunit [Parcubacteria group bacterium GW2011_GWA1_36_12]
MAHLSNIVKSLRDIMRKDAGVDGDAQRISQMVWMIFLKVFDSMEEEQEAEDEKYKSPLPQEIRWRNWADNPEGITGEELLDFVNNRLFKTLKNLKLDEKTDPRGHIIKQVFEDAYNYMKNGILIRQVINKINEIDFTSAEDRHLFNDIYETILKELQSAGSAGEFYTPRPVTQFIVDMVNPKLGDIVLDPACGTGGFLISTLNHLKKDIKNIEDQNKLEKNIRGIEKKPLPHLLAMTNLILHDIEVPSIRRDNSLARPIIDYGDRDKVDAVVTNPPFGGAEEEGIENNFPAEFRTRETADLFLVLIMKLLRDGGKCGLVLPDGFLFGEGVKTRIKEKLLSEFNLHTIVRLPNGVFSPYTGIRTNLLFFEKNNKGTKDVWYFEHPLPEGAKTYNKTKPIHHGEFQLEKEWWNNREDEQFKHLCWKVSKDDIIKRAFNLDINNPTKPEAEKELSKEEIIERISANIQASMAILKEIKGER